MAPAVSEPIDAAGGAPAISAAALVQRRLWGTDPQAWAELAEAHNRPLFSAVLDAARVGPGTAVLDVGCGAGLTLALAAERGALVSGLDVSPGLLGVARRRLPGADLRDGDMESLPFPDGAFAAPERSQGTAAHEAMNALIPPGQSGDHAPYALSAPGNLESALADAGLRVSDADEVGCCWRYACLEDAFRALLCSAGGARAAEAAGEDAVRDALGPVLARFQAPFTGVVTMENTFRWVAANRP